MSKKSLFYNNSFCVLNVFAICSNTFIPSIAAEVIPPAYQAPSPAGINPAIFVSKLSLRTILTGEEVLVSTADNTTSSLLNPSIFLPK